MKDQKSKVAMSHLMSPEYKGDLIEYFDNQLKKAFLHRIVQSARPWYQTIQAVKKTLDMFISDTGCKVERRGGNFYFHPENESFHESKSYPMLFILPEGETYLSDASHREREHEEKASKRETPQHEPPLGAEKYNMTRGIKKIIDQLSEKKNKRRYH